MHSKIYFCSFHHSLCPNNQKSPEELDFLNFLHFQDTLEKRGVELFLYYCATLRIMFSILWMNVPCLECHLENSMFSFWMTMCLHLCTLINKYLSYLFVTKWWPKFLFWRPFFNDLFVVTCKNEYCKIFKNVPHRMLLI